MFKPKTLLKVVSILLIIAGVLGLIGTASSYLLIPRMDDIPGISMEVILDTLTPLNLIISVISSFSCIGAGIFGISGKSIKWAAICAGIYTLLLLVSTLQTAMRGMLSPFEAVNFIVPALYWWGLYQSK